MIDWPTFDLNRIFVEPWMEFAGSTFWIVLMGFLVATTCGLVGVYLILRKLALVGDAMSHSILPGIALAFLISASRATFPMMIGAIIAGVLTVLLIEMLHKTSVIKTDAAIGIVFSVFFAVGVIIISVFSSQVDLDTECVLYGEIAFIPLEPLVGIGPFPESPLPVFRMGLVMLGVIGLILMFYKELLVTSFDEGLAKSLGISPKLFHYGLMIILSIVVVNSFESVGAILVIAMLIFPGATGMLCTNRLPWILGMVPFWGALYALGGYHLAHYLDISIAASMSVVAMGLFGCSWGGYWVRMKTVG